MTDKVIILNFACHKNSNIQFCLNVYKINELPFVRSKITTII